MTTPAQQEITLRFKATLASAAHRMGGGATTKQYGYIASLMAKKGVTPADWDLGITNTNARLNSRQASTIIDDLLQMADQPDFAADLLAAEKAEAQAEVSEEELVSGLQAGDKVAVMRANKFFKDDNEYTAVVVQNDGTGCCEMQMVGEYPDNIDEEQWFDGGEIVVVRKI